MQVFLYLLVIAGVIYLSVAFHIYLTQSGRLYLPHKDLITTPDRHGIAYDEVYFSTTDSVNLNGWFIPCPGARKVVLFFHGNTRNISDCIETIEIFQKAGLAVFLFDYRGYGQSEGRPDEEGTYRDAEAAWIYLIGQRTYTPADIIVIGRSLGAAIASWLAARVNPAAVVLESTFTSLPDLAAELHPMLPVRLLSRFEYPVLRHVTQIHCPILIVHGKEDEVIPYHHGRALYEAANEPKKFLNISGTHYDGFLASGDHYIAKVREFLDRYS